ncbi:MAG: hypothetical protein ACE5OY_06145 [Candidatus Bathyarchaeia archaeon]
MRRGMRGKEEKKPLPSFALRLRELLEKSESIELEDVNFRAETLELELPEGMIGMLPQLQRLLGLKSKRGKSRV